MDSPQSCVQEGCIYRVVPQSKVYCCLILLSSGLKGEGYVALHPDCIQVPQNSSGSTEMHMHGSKPKQYDRSEVPTRFVSWLEHLESRFLPGLFIPLAIYRVIPALRGCVSSYLQPSFNLPSDLLLQQGKLCVNKLHNIGNASEPAQTSTRPPLLP